MENQKITDDSRITVLTVLGTRPEIIKFAPLLPNLDTLPGFRHLVLHTGQHYSFEMDAVFFSELGLRPVDVQLGVGSSSHAAQTAAILVGVETFLQKEHVDLVLVLGDTNSTLGASLAAAKQAVPVVHIEAGCRSFVKTMPEEINRVLVDRLSTLLLAPDPQAQTQLLAEGFAPADIRVVGSTAVTAARLFAGKAASRSIAAQVLTQFGHSSTEPFLLCTVHRAENTTQAVLPDLLCGLGKLAMEHLVLWPVHPRTRRVLDDLCLTPPNNVILLPPLGYLDVLCLLQNAIAVCTDSGGLQEEAYAVGTPVLILRNETEWSYLVEAGCATLIGYSSNDIAARGLPCLSDSKLAAMRTAAQKLTMQRFEKTTDNILSALQERFC